jgi:hypothetical protein
MAEKDELLEDSKSQGEKSEERSRANDWKVES